MCSRSDDEGDTCFKEDKSEEPEFSFHDHPEPCSKCGKPGACVQMKSGGSFCKDCFQVYIVHKFRSTIGKSKLIRDGERVLVAFSGGVNSRALLHLIQDGLSKRAHKKLRFTPVLIHVDEDVLRDKSIAGAEKVASVLESSHFPSYMTGLELALTLKGADPSTKSEEEEKPKVESAVKNKGPASPFAPVPNSYLYWRPIYHHNCWSSTLMANLRTRLMTVLAGLDDTTARSDFLRHLRYRLLASIARQMGLDKILTADTSTRLAVQIMSDTALGRGAQSPVATGFADQRSEDVMFLKPVRELASFELSQYLTLFDGPLTEQLAQPETPLEDHPLLVPMSQMTVTETFIMNLHTAYMAVTNNIIRTAEKMKAPENVSTPQKASGVQNGSGAQSAHAPEGATASQPKDVFQEDKCCFCLSLIESTSKGLSVKDAVRESVLRCEPKYAGEEKAEEVEYDKDGNRIIPVMYGLCYACHKIFSTYKGEWEDLPDCIMAQRKDSTKYDQEFAEFQSLQNL